MGMQMHTLLTQFHPAALKWSAKFTVARLNPIARTDYLGHQHHANKLSPEIVLHLKWNVKVKQRYLWHVLNIRIVINN